MKFATLVTALAVAVPAALGLTINTPSDVVPCQPTLLAWSGGNGPYYLSILPAAQTSAPAIEQLPTQNGTSYSWTVNLQSGVSFTLALKDSSGNTAYSDIITVQPGGSSSCINSSLPVPSGTSGSSATGASTADSGTTAGASASATGASSPASSGTSTGTAAGSSSTKSSGADRVGVSSLLGLAVVGLVGAAVF